MSPALSAEIHEFCGSLQNRAELLREHRSFLDRHINLSATEKESVSSGFQIQMRVRSAGGFSVVHSAHSGGISIRLSRRAADIGTDGRDRFHLLVPTGGQVTIAQLGRNQKVSAGSFAFVTEASPCVVETLHVDGRSNLYRLMMPRELIDHRLSVGERFCLRSYGGSEAFRKLLLSTVSSLCQRAWGLTTDEFLASVRALMELLLLALEGSTDMLSAAQSVRMANLARAKRIIRRRLADPDLTPGDIAREVGTSLSYLQKLFQDQGQAIYEYLRDERLLRARGLLCSSRGMMVTEVFLRCGFSDKSYFSRAFKQKFGVTPREVANSSSPHAPSK